MKIIVIGDDLMVGRLHQAMISHTDAILIVDDLVNNIEESVNRMNEMILDVIYVPSEDTNKLGIDVDKQHQLKRLNHYNLKERVRWSSNTTKYFKHVTPRTRGREQRNRTNHKTRL